MSFYELPAAKRGYYYFEKRDEEVTFAHFHAAIEILFVKEGQQDVVLDGEKYTLSAGEGCWIDSFCVHSCAGIPADMTVYALLGDRAYFESFFRDRPGYTLPRRFRFTDFDLLESLYRACKTPRKTPEDDRLVFSGVVRTLLGTIAGTAGTVVRKDDKQESLVCEILRYVQGNLTSDLSLAELSLQFGYSREHLSRILHRYLNENWNEYVNRLRVEKAEGLLRERGDKNVLEILLECGFNSPNTFYRAYKKEFTDSPRNSGK